MINIEAERAVVGSLLLGYEENTEDVVAILEPDDFYDPRCRAVYSAILAEAESGVIDVSTIWERVKNSNLFSDPVEIVKYTDYHVPNVMHVARIVKDNSILRKLSQLGAELMNGAKEKSASELLELAEYRIFKLSEERTFQTYHLVSELLSPVFNHLEELAKKVKEGVPVTGIPTGYEALDSMIGGFREGDFVIIAARPSMGKTAFALNLALNAARARAPVMFFSLEMSYQQLIERLLSTLSLVDLYKIRHGRLEEKDWRALVAAADKLMKLPIVIDDESLLDLRTTRAKLRRAKREHGIKIAFIDYLQLMHAKPSESRQQQIAEISRGLKLLARELQITIVALSQLSRAVEQREDKRPRLSDLRESGAIEQDADIVMFLYKDSYYKMDEEKKPADEVEIIIGKQRNGPTGTVTLLFNNNTTGFFNISVIQQDA
jgi:replicative DNA helicase